VALEHDPIAEDESPELNDEDGVFDQGFESHRAPQVISWRFFNWL